MGAVLECVLHKADSVGVRVWPITFVPIEALREIEQWARTDLMLSTLAGLSRDET